MQPFQKVTAISFFLAIDLLLKDLVIVSKLKTAVFAPVPGQRAEDSELNSDTSARWANHRPFLRPYMILKSFWFNLLTLQLL